MWNDDGSSSREWSSVAWGVPASDQFLERTRLPDLDHFARLGFLATFAFFAATFFFALPAAISS